MTLSAAAEKAGKKRRAPGRTFRGVLPAAFSVILCAAALIMPSAAAKGAAEGVRMCLSTVAPSLFTLMFASIFMTECGVSGYISRLLSPVCSRLFGMSGCSGTAVLTALLGGYPAGAKAVSMMYEKRMISEDEAALLPLFCFGAGPAFIIGVIGGMTSMREAVLLLLVQPPVIIMCGLAVRLLYGRVSRAGTAEDTRAEPDSRAPARGRSVAECAVSAVDGTAGAMLNICLYVVLFSSLRSMLARSGASDAAEALLLKLGADRALAEAALPVLLEITSGSAYAVRAGLPAAAFALGFGGLSVHMQVYGICRKLRVSPLRFTLMRLFQGGVSALLTKAVTELAPALGCGAYTAVSGSPEHRLTASCPAGAVTLLVMCMMWTLFINEPRPSRLIRREK